MRGVSAQTAKGQFVLNPPVRKEKSHPVVPLYARLQDQLGEPLELKCDESTYAARLHGDTLCLVEQDLAAETRAQS